MIQLPAIRLSKPINDNLSALQRRIDNLDSYENRVLEAGRLFDNANRPNNATFREVRRFLIALCSGAKRCCYCEDSYADEVEHIKPKSLYPEETFIWENYVYACGPCNSPKGNNFVVFSHITGNVTDVMRKKGEPVVAPEPGDPLLINPRFENPLTYLELDLVDTFFFVPSYEEGTREHERARFTVGLLRLNERDALPLAREEAYVSYRARLREYIEQRDEGLDTDALINSLKRMGHPTVWFEMKRQKDYISELKNLFDRAPEALIW